MFVLQGDQFTVYWVHISFFGRYLEILRFANSKGRPKTLSFRCLTGILSMEDGYTKVSSVNPSYGFVANGTVDTF